MPRNLVGDVAEANAANLNAAKRGKIKMVETPTLILTFSPEEKEQP